MILLFDLLNETKVTDVAKLLKARVKVKIFSIGYCKYEQKKYIISFNTSVG